MREAKKPKCSGCKGKSPGLWCNMCRKKARGEPPAKPGDKNYPKTLNVGEATLRKVIRSHLLREHGIIDAALNAPWSIIPGIIGIFNDIFAPTQAERLAKTGDDRIISDYQTFLGTLHTTPEYKTVWENYKQAQRRHASMDSDLDRARDVWSPVGRAFMKLRTKVMSKLRELERTLSPENRELWQPSVDQSREEFEKIFNDWSSYKITTGRVLSMLDPKGIVESRRRGRRMSEGSEMFAGRDLHQLQTSAFLNALETAHMDLEDAGCPPTSGAYTLTHQAMEDIDAMREEPDYDTRSLFEIGHEVIEAIRNCPHIDGGEAARIAGDVEDALSNSQVMDRY